MDNYMEYLVKRGKTPKDFIIKGICVWLVLALCIFSWMLQGMLAVKAVLFVLTVVVLCVSYFYVFPRTDVEYEYLYLDKAISVDIIYAKSKRKELGSFDLERTELLCPLNSDRLSEYKNKKMTVLDYSSGMNSDEHKPYALIYSGNKKIILDLPEDFVKMVQNNAPRKVFFN